MGLLHRICTFRMAHTPLKISVADVQNEVHYAWTNSYSPAATKRALDSIGDEPVPYKISHFVARIFFRGTYFPPKGVWQWLKPRLETPIRKRPAIHSPLNPLETVISPSSDLALRNRCLRPSAPQFLNPACVTLAQVV
jgi:hypothetical protein